MPTLILSELVADDDGFQIDEQGQADDWFELSNHGSTAVPLAGLTIEEANGRRHPLPALSIAPGAALLLWADGSPQQGARHLDFKLSARGGRLVLRHPSGAVVDEVTYPAADTNEAFARFGAPLAPGSAWHSCRYASPGRPNGASCEPPPPTELPAEVAFAKYAGPPLGVALPGPLVVSGARLRAQRPEDLFIEIANTTEAPVALADFALRLHARDPHGPVPGAGEGQLVAWPAGTLAAKAKLRVPVAAAALADIAARPELEGDIAIFRAADGQAVQRLDFTDLPADARLELVTRSGEAAVYALCAAGTPERCQPVARPLPSRARQLLAAGELAALAAGGTELDSLAVKVVIDMERGDEVHFLAARRWPLHYTFVRENIYREPALDRCNPVQAQEFDAAWREFSSREYFGTTGRRFLLATLVRHGGSGISTLEFDRADEITGEQMRRALRAVAGRVVDPGAWAIRPQGDRQVQALKAIEGSVPIVDANAPFRGITFQAITPGIGYGVLRFVPARELAHARLGLDVVVVTDDVPNDVPLTGGLLTEAFQTPLSHIGILTRNRGTPNMALVGARADARVAGLLGKLVRIEVGGGTFSLRTAEPAEAQQFWDTRRPKGPRIVPRANLDVRDVQDLRMRSLDDLPALGAKAAQMAELMRVTATDEACRGPIPTPREAWAVPIVHGLEHFRDSGAQRLFAAGRARPDFASDPAVRAAVLAEMRAAILAHPVEARLLVQLEALARTLFGTARFRLRSSSNTEDLIGFSGAGLYASVSAAIGDRERTIADGLRTVWASLWAERAFEEREVGNIEQTAVAMGVLIHEAFDGVERANGVLVSRDTRDPIKASVVTINAQAGEASVTNPAPGVVGDELSFAWWKTPPVVMHSRSSLVAGPVLTPAEIARLGCWIRAIEVHFRGRLDPRLENRWFTMESEFKLIGPERRPILKQARPYSFGSAAIPIDCREF